MTPHREGGPSRGALARDLFLYGSLVTVWGASFFFTAIALESFGPLTLVLTRMVLASAALNIVVRLRGLRMPRDRRVLGHFLVLGAFNIALPFTLLTWAQLHVNSSMTVVLSASTPVFVFLIASLVTRTERFSAPRLCGIAAALAGITALYGGGGTVGGWPAAVVLSSMIFAAGNVYTRRMSGLDPLVAACGQITAAALLLLPVTTVAGGLAFSPHVLPILAALELGLLGSATGYLLFFRFILRWGSTAASFNTYLQPIVGLLLGIVVLGEAMTSRQWLSLGLILTGLLLFAFGTARDSLRSPAPSPRGGAADPRPHAPTP